MRMTTKKLIARIRKEMQERKLWLVSASWGTMNQEPFAESRGWDKALLAFKQILDDLEKEVSKK